MNRGSRNGVHRPGRNANAAAAAAALIAASQALKAAEPSMLTLSMSPEVRSGSPVAPGPTAPPVTFADLIRMREEQQRRIRVALEDQNARLQTRLRQNIGAGAADGGSVPVEEFVRFVADTREVIAKAHESDMAALRALHEQVERQGANHAARLAELEGRVTVVERMRTLLTDEQENQRISLDRELSDVRASLERASATITAHEKRLAEVAAAAGEAQLLGRELEDRLVPLEGLPVSLRQEMATFDTRTREFRTKLQAEMDELRAQFPDTQTKLSSILSRAEEALAVLQTHADNAINTASQQAEHIESLIEQGITETGNALEALLLEHYEEHAGRLQILESTNTQRIDDFEKRLTSGLKEITEAAEAGVQTVEKRNSESVAAALRELWERAHAFEEERRREYPVADSQRIEMMIQELEGAFVVLDGLARKAAAGTINLDNHAMARLAALEIKVAGLALDTETSFVPRLTFTVATQTQPSGAESGALRSQKQLEHETELAARRESLNQITRAVDMALDIAQRRSQPGTPRVATPTTPRRGLSAKQRDELTKKEAAAAHIQTVLTTISDKLQELSEKEPKELKTERDRKLSEQILKHKSAIYEKERQLLEKRNELLRDIRDIKGCALPDSTVQDSDL